MTCCATYVCLDLNTAQSITRVRSCRSLTALRETGLQRWAGHVAYQIIKILVRRRKWEVPLRVPMRGYGCQIAYWNTNKQTNAEGHVIVAVRRQILTAEARIRYK